MRFEFVPYPLLVGICALIILDILLWKQKPKPGYLIAFSTFWLYLLLVVSLTLFPIPFPESIENRQPASYILSKVNRMPFAFGGLFDLPLNVIFENLAGNILLTIPFGFGICFLNRLPAKYAVWLGLAAGLSLEGAQLIISLLIGSAYRSVDVNDVLLNGLGVLMGSGFFRMRMHIYRLIFQQS